MRRYSQRQSLSSLSEINITPLLDLAFVLLIIFMITTPLLENSMNLVIPSSGEKNPAISSEVQTISLDRNGALQLNNQPVDLDSLGLQLSELKQRNREVTVVIRPDRALPVQKLVNVMDALQHAQITRVGVATKAETK
jgi:biopolymer transport protein ExbD